MLRQHNAELRVEQACFEVNTKDGTRKILNELDLIARSRQLWALMGPSGAGKTTFLELIALELRGGKASGSVTLNDEQLDFEVFRKHAVYVEQYDTHWGYLTCREIMNYAAELYIPGDPDEQKASVQNKMEQLGLLECADTMAGNAFLKGLSGGQRKRLTLGVACLKKPVLMLLDEPTSGLDAASAAGVTGYLQKLAHEDGIIVIATIHQPATDVFLLFDKVLFLTSGREAYNGPANKVADYCSFIGQPLPPMTNPADFFLNLINSEFVGREKVDEIVAMKDGDFFKNLPPQNAYFEFAGDDSGSDSDASARGSVLGRGSFGTRSRQTCTLLRRSVLLSFRDPSLYMGRMLAFLIANCFFSLVYIKGRQLNQTSVDARVSLLVWLIAVPSIFSVVVVFCSNEEFRLVRMEIKNGLIRSRSYVLSNFIMQLPYMFILALSALVVPWFIPAYPWKPFPLVLLTVTAMLWAFEGFASFMGVAFKNASVGMLAMIGLWFSCFLFMGVFLSEDFIDWPFRAFIYILPLSWTTKSITWLTIHDSEFAGAESLPDGSFKCPNLDASALACWGHTGVQVLKSQHSIRSSVQTEDHVMFNLLMLLVIGAVAKLAHIIAVVLQTRAGRPVNPKSGQTKRGMAGSDDDLL
eukprot:TRINITY_DN40609_c0_g1_i1.p1 TRINITY_DN40609_c0_g1~~TRINITY_DN40609_c0_g1_i1.p1  ORF type:complete len:639 (-),score=121.46 TRINITY_DN40609_c0_g1_i1:148-2064(-)